MKKRLTLFLSALFIYNYSTASDSSAELRQIMHEVERANGELQVSKQKLKVARETGLKKLANLAMLQERQRERISQIADRTERQEKLLALIEFQTASARMVDENTRPFVEKRDTKQANYDAVQERLKSFMQRKIEDEELDRLQAEGPRFEAEELDGFARKYGRRPYPIIKNFLSEDYYEETFYYGYQALAKTNAMENMKYAVIDYVGTSGLFGLACLIKAWTSLPILHSSNSTYEL